MSNTDKENEIRCFSKAIESGCRRGGETKRIMKYLDGPELERNDPERPDFIKVCPPRFKSDKGTLIGIEHFSVDHHSEKKTKSKKPAMISLGAKSRSEAHKVYENWNEAVAREKSVPDEAILDFAKLLESSTASMKKASYRSFIESFKLSFNKHLEKIPEYKKTLQKYASSGQGIELAFLIETHSDFKNLFLGDPEKVRKCEPGFLPMFEEVVQILEQAEGRVDYIVLLMEQTLSGNEVEAFALRCHSIRKSLDKQKMKIYTYVGEDLITGQDGFMLNEPLTESTIDRHDGQIDIRVSCISTDIIRKQKFVLAYCGCKLAREVIKRGQNYAATMPVHMFVEFHQFAGDPPRHISPEEWEKFFNDFKEKWDIKP